MVAANAPAMAHQQPMLPKFLLSGKRALRAQRTLTICGGNP